MMNVKTLESHYPSPSCLTATQLISLHLLLHRPLRNGESSDPLFGPYISVLPRDFDSHPVTWAVDKDRRDSVGTRLLESLPPSATMVLWKVSHKFWSDWTVVCKYIVRLSLLQRNTLIFSPLQAEAPLCYTSFYEIPAENCRHELSGLFVPSGLPMGMAQWFKPILPSCVRDTYLITSVLQSTQDVYIIN